MQNTQKKIINFRPIFYCFIAFALGIVFFKPIFNLDYLTIIGISVLLLTLIFVCVKFKQYKRLFIILLAFILGLCWYEIGYRNFVGKTYNDSVYTISGRVKNNETFTYSEIAYIENVVVNGEKVKGNFSVYIKTDGYQVTCIGDIITFDAKIEDVKYYSFGSFNSSAYRNKISKSCEVLVNDLDIVRGEMNFSEKLKFNIKNLLDLYMDEDSSSIAYASLFGDKSEVDAEIINSFKVSGVSHLLATSGMHVGFIVLIISWILSKIKLKEWIKAIIYMGILFFYAFLCGFTPSILRAVIMFGIIKFASVLGLQNDSLNAWSLAGFIILLIRPLYVFDSGFLLSFFSVLFIILWTKPISNLLKRIKCPNWLAKALSATFGVQAGLLIVMGMFCENFSIISFLTNLIVIPLFEFAFIFNIFACFLTAGLSFMSFSLHIPNKIFFIIIQFTKLITNQSWAIIPIFAFTTLMTISIYALIFFNSRYVFAKRTTKLIYTCILLAIICPICMLQVAKENNSTNKITILNTYEECYILEYEQKSYFIGSPYSYSDLNTIKNYLKQSKHYSFDYMIMLNDKLLKEIDNLSSNIILINENPYSQETTYQLFEYKKDISTPIDVVGYNITSKIGEIYISPYSTLKGYVINFGSQNIYFSYDNKFSNKQQLEYNNMIGNIDVYIGGMEYEQINHNQIGCAILNKENIVKNETYLQNIKGSWTFLLKDGNIENVRRID